MFLHNVLDATNVLYETRLQPYESESWFVVGEAVQRRRYARVKSPGVLVAWQASSTRDVSRLETLGLGGMFVLTTQPLPISTTLQLLLDLPLGKVRALAAVRRVVPLKGMGVEFISMSQEDRARLNQALLMLPGRISPGA